MCNNCTAIDVKKLETQYLSYHAARKLENINIDFSLVELDNENASNEVINFRVEIAVSNPINFSVSLDTSHQPSKKENQRSPRPKMLQLLFTQSPKTSFTSTARMELCTA